MKRAQNHCPCLKEGKGEKSDHQCAGIKEGQPFQLSSGKERTEGGRCSGKRAATKKSGQSNTPGKEKKYTQTVCADQKKKESS